MLRYCDDNIVLPISDGNMKIFINNCHLKYHGYCKYHNISKLVVTVKLFGFITYVEKILIHKPYNFYDICYLKIFNINYHDT